MKKIIQLLLIALISVSLVGCANIKDDSTRTKTEGTLLGGGLGAGLGALVGGLAGGSQGALIGAGIGLGVGALGGFFVGKHVADKKAEYASREDWLDACIEHSERLNAETRQYNAHLRHDIQVLDKQSASLAAEYRNRKISRDKLRAAQNDSKRLLNDSQKTAAQLEKERAKQRQVANEARSLGDTRRAKKLDQEIAKLDKEIKQMRENNKKLANISMRLAV